MRIEFRIRDDDGRHVATLAMDSDLYGHVVYKRPNKPLRVPLSQNDWGEFYMRYIQRTRHMRELLIASGICPVALAYALAYLGVADPAAIAIKQSYRVNGIDQPISFAQGMVEMLKKGYAVDVIKSDGSTTSIVQSLNPEEEVAEPAAK